jgi:hypothetical protein
MTLRNFIITICIGAGTLLYSCKKSSDENPEPQAPSTNDNDTTNDDNSTLKGTLLLHLHTYISESEVDGYNITYTNEDGRKTSLSMSQFYISDIQIEKLDGTLISLGDKKIIKTLSIQSYDLGLVDAGNYKSVRFKVGLPAATNALAPSASADSVILKRTEMWFNSTALPDGYVYLNVQGLIDTSADLSDKMAPFVYKIGTNDHYKQVIINQNFGVSPNNVTYFHMLADINKLFNGITLTASNLNVTTVGDNSGVLAGKIADNISSMFISE